MCGIHIIVTEMVCRCVIFRQNACTAHKYTHTASIPARIALKGNSSTSHSAAISSLAPQYPPQMDSVPESPMEKPHRDLSSLMEPHLVSSSLIEPSSKSSRWFKSHLSARQIANGRHETSAFRITSINWRYIGHLSADSANIGTFSACFTDS